MKKLRQQKRALPLLMCAGIAAGCAGIKTSPVAPAPPSLCLMDKNTRDFMDKVNKVTLRVIYYRNDEQGQKRAYELARHLEEMGFPAIYPLPKGEYVYVCVGAAPSRRNSDLLTYQKEMRLVPDCSSAFVYPIDKLISR